MAKSATREALLNYALPAQMSRRDCETLLRSPQGERAVEEVIEVGLPLSNRGQTTILDPGNRGLSPISP
jgi:hypothetical protein